MNLYMPVYEQLENEVISLTNNILFNDTQINVCSLNIGNIIIRCAIEIESISKELYKQLGGSEKRPYFDKHCIALLNREWGLDKKIIQITHPNMFFSQKTSMLQPLYKADEMGGKGSKWKQAYQGIKHNRSQEISNATINNMINALGTLYILNLYYSDERFWFERLIEARRQFTTGSKIFTPAICDATKISISANQNAILSLKNLEQSIFIIKFTDEAYKTMHRALCKPLIQYIFSQNPSALTTISSQIALASVEEYVRLLRKDALNIKDAMKGLKNKEVIINKTNDVYPIFSLEEFLQSNEGQEYLLYLANNPQ